MTDYVMSVRAIRSGRFVAHVGNPTFLTVPEGQVPSPAHKVTAAAWYKSVRDAAVWANRRNETRGVGGIFFDYLQGDMERLFAFVKDAGEAFLPAYLPIVELRRDHGYGEREREFQLIRRGRYVEFNLLYGRGTLFGLKTGGNIDAILMSLPPLAKWS